MKIFIDDEREPVDSDFIVVRSYEQFVFFVTTAGRLPNYISFDHDLGGEYTGFDIAVWIVDQVLDGVYELPDDFDFYVHSQNPIGKRNIEGYLSQFIVKIQREKKHEAN